MPFIEMDPADVWKAIEGHVDELSPKAKALEVFYKQFTCPRCRGPVRKEISPSHAFGNNSLVGRALLRCETDTCNYLFDPHSGISVEMGKLVLVREMLSTRKAASRVVVRLSSLIARRTLRSGCITSAIN